MSYQDLRPVGTSHNNADLIIWALYLAGGAENWVDVEDLYLKAFDLAPARLSWRTKHDIPDYKKCAKALQEVEDSTSPKYLPVFIKNGPYERRLAADGLKWCEENEDHLQALYSSSRRVVPSASSQDDARRIRAITSSSVYVGWAKSGELSCELWELAEALRCRASSPIATWQIRLDDHLISAQRNGSEDLERFLAAARKYIDEEVTSR